MKEKVPMKQSYVILAIVVLAIVAGGAYYFSNGYTVPNYTTSSTTTLAPSGSSATTTATAAPSSVHITTSFNQLLGTYFVDSNGMTLYRFTKDTAGTQTSDPVSACSGACLQAWPPLSADSVTVASGFNINDFTIFTRSDGTKQVAFKGIPLYYYVGDTKSGDTNGQGLNNFWFAINPDLTATTTTTQISSGGSGY